MNDNTLEPERAVNEPAEATGGRPGSKGPYRLKANPAHVFRIGEARESLSRIVVEVGSDTVRNVVIGSRGKPTMICVSYDRFRPLLAHGNRAEKLALLVVEELLPDAPQHIRAPALDEISRLPMSDIESLWGIESFPLAEADELALQRRMKNPQALERLARRARVADVLAQARKAGLYDVLGDAMDDVVDEVAE